MGDGMSMWDIMPEGVDEPNFDEPVQQEPVNEEPQQQEEPKQEEEQENQLDYSFDTEPKPEEEPQQEFSSYGKMMNDFVNSGLIEYDEESEVEYEDNEEGFKQFLSDSLENARDQGVEEFIDELPQDAKNLLQALYNGNTVEQYLQDAQEFDFSKVPLEHEGNQIALVEDFMKSQGYSDDQIAKRIKILSDSNMIYDEAVIAKEKLVQMQKSKLDERDAQRQQELRQQEQQQAYELEQFKNEVYNLRSIENFPVSEQQARNLYDYITQPVDEEGNTQFQLDDSPEKRMLYAFFTMNNWDANTLSRQERSKQVVRLKRELSNYTSSNTSSAGRQREQEEQDNYEIPNWFGVNTGT